MNKTRLFAVVAAFGLTVLATPHSADAGRFGIFRRATPQRTFQQPRTVWAPRKVYSQPTPARRTTTRQSTGRNRWPGAIGAPSHRYEFFQDSFGYWD